MKVALRRPLALVALVIVGSGFQPVAEAQPAEVNVAGGPCAGGQHRDEDFVEVIPVPFTWPPEDEHLDPQEVWWPITGPNDGLFVNGLTKGDLAYFDYLRDEWLPDRVLHVYEWYGLSQQHNCQFANLCPEQPTAAEILDWVARSREALEQGTLNALPAPPICDT